VKGVVYLATGVNVRDRLLATVVVLAVRKDCSRRSISSAMEGVKASEPKSSLDGSTIIGDRAIDGLGEGTA
jgi:hypothetical protein